MAIVRPGPLVGAISGAVGGVTFVSGRGSPVVRHRPAMRTVSSPSLAAARGSMQSVRNFWKTLTDEQQDSWTTTARDTPHTNRLGVTSPISGFQLMVQTNIRVVLGGDALESVPLPGGVSAVVQNVTVDFSAAGDYDILGDALDPPTVSRYLLYGWPFYTDKPTRSVPRLRFLRFVAGIGFGGDFRTQWVDLFGELQVGQQFAIGVTGRIPSQAFADLVIVRGEVSA